VRVPDHTDTDKVDLASRGGRVRSRYFEPDACAFGKDCRQPACQCSTALWALLTLSALALIDPVTEVLSAMGIFRQLHPVGRKMKPITVFT